MLKKLMIGAALAAMVSVPAMAQSWDPSVGSGNLVRPYTQPYSGPTMPQSTYGHSAYDEGYGGGAYAFAPSHEHAYYGHHRAHRWDRD